MDMRVWTGGEGSIGSRRRASPEYSLSSPGAPAGSKLGWWTLRCFTMQIRSPRAHVLLSLIDTYQLW